MIGRAVLAIGVHNVGPRWSTRVERCPDKVLGRGEDPGGDDARGQGEREPNTEEDGDDGENQGDARNAGTNARSM